MEKEEKKVEFIPNHDIKTCWCCEGKGCKECDYKGKYTEEGYHLIYTTKNGQKIGFSVDGLK